MRSGSCAFIISQSGGLVWSRGRRCADASHACERPRLLLASLSKKALSSAASIDLWPSGLLSFGGGLSLFAFFGRSFLPHFHDMHASRLHAFFCFSYLYRLRFSAVGRIISHLHWDSKFMCTKCTRAGGCREFVRRFYGIVRLPRSPPCAEAHAVAGRTACW